MPETSIITKETKEKIEKPKYQDYEDYSVVTYNKIDERLIRGNVISNENYVIAMNQKGEGVSKYKDIYINRFKKTDDYPQGIFFDIKNIKTKNIWSSCQYKETNNYKISFMPDKIEQEIEQDNIKTKIQTIITPDDNSEIRKVTLENRGLEEEILEITAYFEPVLSKKEQDYAHPVFNNLFLKFNYDENTNSILVKRRTREKSVDPSGIFLKADIVIIAIPIIPKSRGIRVADKPYFFSLLSELSLSKYNKSRTLNLRILRLVLMETKEKIAPIYTKVNMIAFDENSKLK